MPPMPQPPTKRRRWIGRISVGVAAAVVLYAAAWFIFAAQVHSAAVAWLNNQINRPTHVRCPDVAVAGFPGPVVLTCTAPLGVAPGWRWHAPTVQATVVPWSLDAWPFTMPGRHQVDGPDGVWTLSASAINGVIDPTGAVAVQMADVAIDTDGQSWSAKAVDLSIAADLTAGAINPKAFDVIARAVTPPDPLARTMDLGPMIDHAALRAVIEGTVSVSRWPPDPASIASWRDQGGVMQVEHAALSIGDVMMDTDGTLAFDALLQPQAAFTVRVAGWQAALGALVSKGVMARRDAAMAVFVLGAMAQVPEGGGRKVVTAPMTIQDGAVYVGPIRIAVLPPMRWNE